jgi:hypothetical protein
MGTLKLVGNLTLAVLLAPLFAVMAAVSLDLALQLAALLSISLMIGIGIPAYDVLLDLALQLAAGLTLAVSIDLPSITVQLGVGLNAQLLVVLGLITAVQALLNAAAGASLQAFTWQGQANGMGAALGTELATGWPDATPPTAEVEAVILVATTSSAAGSVVGTNLLGGGQTYARGLCTATVAAPPAGGIQATASVTVNPTSTPPGQITGVSIVLPGAGYSPESPPAITLVDATAILAASATTPIVVTVASTTDISAITISNVEGPSAAGLNGPWCAEVLSPTTLALYASCAGGTYTGPAVPSGTWSSGDGGTVTGSGGGAAATPVMSGGAVAQLQGMCSGLTFSQGLVNAGSIAFSVVFGLAFSLLDNLLAELQLQAKLLGTATAKFNVVPPLISGNVSIVAGIIAKLRFVLGLVPPLPSIQAKASAAVGARAGLIGQLVAAIGLLLGFGTESLAVYAYSGPGSGLGPALSGALTSSGSATAVVLGTTTPAASAALSTFMPAALA